MNRQGVARKTYTAPRRARTTKIDRLTPEKIMAMVPGEELADPDAPGLRVRCGKHATAATRGGTREARKRRDVPGNMYDDSTPIANFGCPNGNRGDERTRECLIVGELTEALLELASKRRNCRLWSQSHGAAAIRRARSLKSNIGHQ